MHRLKMRRTVLIGAVAGLIVLAVAVLALLISALAGGVEAVACVLTIRDNVLPPTINYEFPDPDCDLDYVPNEARKHEVDVVLSNSFGLGGQNATLVLRRYRG